MLGPTGSLINNLEIGMKGRPEPEVGMGATYYGYTDRHPYTIVEVSKNKKRVVVQQDHYRRIDNLGMTDSGQRYEFTPNPSAAREVFTLRKNGRWVREGDPMKSGSCLGIGKRDKYHDFSF